MSKPPPSSDDPLDPLRPFNSSTQSTHPNIPINYFLPGTPFNSNLLEPCSPIAPFILPFTPNFSQQSLLYPTNTPQPQLNNMSAPLTDATPMKRSKSPNNNVNNDDDDDDDDGQNNTKVSVHGSDGHMVFIHRRTPVFIVCLGSNGHCFTGFCRTRVYIDRRTCPQIVIAPISNIKCVFVSDPTSSQW